MTRPRKPRQAARKKGRSKSDPRVTRTVCRSCGLLQDCEKVAFRKAALPRCVACGGCLDKAGFAGRLRSEQAAAGLLPPDAPKWHDPAAPRSEAPASSMSDVGYVAGVVPYGKRAGRRLDELSLEQLAGLHGVAIGKGPPAFLGDLKREMDRRREGIGPVPRRPSPPPPREPSRSDPRRDPRPRRPAPPIAADVPFDGRVMWGNLAGQEIGELSDEGLRGATWAAERGVGPPAYVAALRSEAARRGLREEPFGEGLE